MNAVNKPPRSFTISVDGEDREITATYGLVNEMTRVIGTPERLPLIFADHDLRDQFLAVLLAKRSRTGKIEEPFDVNEHVIEYEDVSELIAWGTQHMLGFTMLSADRSARMISEFQTMMTGLTASLNGSAS